MNGEWHDGWGWVEHGTRHSLSLNEQKHETHNHFHSRLFTCRSFPIIAFVAIIVVMILSLTVDVLFVLCRHGAVVCGLVDVSDVIDVRAGGGRREG